MGAHVLMVVLTTMANGAIAGSFVSTDNRADCETRLARVHQILESAATADTPRVLRSGCFTSAQHFSPFQHTQSEAESRFDYLLVINDGKATVTRQADTSTCKAALATTAAAERHCLRSAQTLEEETR